MLKKNELVEKLAAKGYTKKDATVIWNDVISVMIEALANGESVRLYGFGEFAVKEHAARDTVNVHTGERFTVPAFKHPSFTAGKLLKRAVKEGYVRE